MNRNGVIYNTGAVFSGPGWRVRTRPRLDPRVAGRELEIIRDDLHCNAVRVSGRDIGRAIAVTEQALRLGLEVWLSPFLFNRGVPETIRYLAEAARAAEPLRRQWPGRLVFVAGQEATLLTRGILPGATVEKRVAGMRADGGVSQHADALNAFLGQGGAAIRKVFGGEISYASLPFEPVDWSPFDIIGVDHYRDARVKDRYAEVLRPLLAHGKPVVVTEFGMRTYRGADTSGALGFGIADSTSVALHQLPLIGRFIRPRLKAGDWQRDEDLQARELTETLAILQAEGADGAFVGEFVAPQDTYSDEARYDLDMSAMSLVKSYAEARGSTYPDMTWEPKKSFQAVASFYASHQGGLSGISGLDGNAGAGAELAECGAEEFVAPPGRGLHADF
jgi:hypothetical protein